MTVTLIIIIATAILSFSAFNNYALKEKLIFIPTAVTNQNQWYRFLSCALIHQDMPHLLFNMLSLYFFGDQVEAYFSYIFGTLGPLFYILLYVLSQALCLLPTYLKHKDDYYYRSLGASGAVSAVIFAGILLSPLQKVYIFLIPIGIPGFIFGFLYLGITAYLDKNGRDNINHSAHLFGALAGMGLLLILGYLFSPFDLLQNFITQIRSF